MSCESCRQDGVLRKQDIVKATDRKVLLPVDGSDFSKASFDFYLQSLHRDSDIVILCHTLELPPAPPVPFPDVGRHREEWHQVVEEHRKESKDLLDGFIQTFQELKGPEIGDRIIAVHDEKYSPGQAIIATAKDYRATFIVIGSRGLGLIRRTILGSVSDYVVHHSDIPVAVVPPCFS